SGHEDRLIVAFAGMLSQSDNVSGRSLKLFLGQLHLAREIMEMPHERGHDFTKAGIGGTLNFAENRSGYVLLIFDNHENALFARQRKLRTKSYHERGPVTARMRRKSLTTDRGHEVRAVISPASPWPRAPHDRDRAGHPWQQGSAIPGRPET